jgi:1-acyl-sn-glycerol-3-phosphate acyltransferase
MPPPVIRRPVSITLWLVFSVSLLAVSPVLLLVGELVAVLLGDHRLAITTRIAIVYVTRELMTLAACAALWVVGYIGPRWASGSVQALYWRLLGWFVGGIARSVARTLKIRIVQEAGSEAAAAALHGVSPLLVLSRHAGPADTVLLIDRLLSHFERRPSVVFKDSLALDPAVDLLAHRLPHAVLNTDDPSECEAQIARTAAALDRHGVLLLFPEGGNFTPQRRRQAIRSLRRRGDRTAMTAGERMRHVLPPRPAGTVAALRASPTSDVVFAAHTGLGLAAYPREIWRHLPVGGTLRTRMWLVPRSDIPDAEDEIVRWLNDWWNRIDRWIADRGEAWPRTPCRRARGSRV